MAEHLYRPRAKLSPAMGHVSPSLDDLVSKNVMAQLRRDPPPAALPSSRAKPSDADMMTSLLKRLQQLETELKAKSSQLQLAAQENDALRGKLRSAETELLQRNSVSAAQLEGKAVAHLQAENSRLRHQMKAAWRQVSEMKEFLNDYGMVWVGEPEEGTGDDGLWVNPAAAAAPSAAAAAAAPSSSRPPLPPHSPAPSSSAAGASSSSALQPLPGPSGTPRRTSSDTGGSGSRTPAAAASGHPPGGTSAATVTALPPLPFPKARFMSALDELNQMAGDGCGRLVTNRDGDTVLHTPEPVRLTLYADGLQLHRYPAQPYCEPSAHSVVNDVLDGYFPYCLKDDFPDGVPIKLIDKTGERLPSGSEGAAAAAAAAGRNAPGGNVRTFDDIESGKDVGQPLSRQQFLGKLPQSVIRNGRVIDIRGGVSKALGADEAGSKAAVSVIHTPVDALLSTMQRNHVGPTLPSAEAGSAQDGGALGGGAAPASTSSVTAAAAAAAAASSSYAAQVSGDGEAADAPRHEITTLQVKSEDGKQTYIIKLKYDDTIGALRKYLDAHRSKQVELRGTKYEIRSAFPARGYADDAETLRVAGLVPNATLFLRLVQPQQ